jgi:methylase of polypeptide subunit release factors
MVSIVIEHIRARWPPGSTLNLVDLCCGTGVLGLSILKELEGEYLFRAWFIDIDAKAIRFSQRNAVRNDVKAERISFVLGDMLDHL